MSHACRCAWVHDWLATSRRVGLSMETSSTIRTLASLYLFSTLWFEQTCFTTLSRCCFSSDRSSCSSMEVLMPANWCTVVPPMAQAASPVVAVTNTEPFPCISTNASMRASNKVVLPVPAPPVQNTFLPLRHAWITLCCMLVKEGLSSLLPLFLPSKKDF